MGKLKAVAELFEGRYFDREVIILCVRVRFAPDLYGAFPVKRFFIRSGKGRSSSPRLRSSSRSARKGSRDRNASGAWRLAALASLVFRSALTPEHAEGG